MANRNQRRRQRTRETILAAAELVFRRKGIDGVAVNDITEQADVAYGSFYNHFKSIDEIVGALVAASLQWVADRTGSIGRPVVCTGSDPRLATTETDIR